MLPALAQTPSLDPHPAGAGAWALCLPAPEGLTFSHDWKEIWGPAHCTLEDTGQDG